MPNRRIFLSLVVPVFNESEAIGVFHAAVRPILDELGQAAEIIFVNDGSTDETLERLLQLCEREQDVIVIDLSRNFGKEAALTAGLSEARGDAVVILDIDLQDPPSLISDMVAKWRAGADTVVALRVDRSSDSAAKRLTAKWFYRIFNAVSDTRLREGSGDFRLMDRRVVAAFLRLGERARFNKGLFAWLGFREAYVEYARPTASRPGSRWNMGRLFRFAFDGIFSFSSAPIQIWSVIGAMVALVSMVYGFYLLQRTLIWGIDVPGYASTMVAVLFLGGLNLFTLGLLGEYIGRILIETKQRPLYLIRERYGPPAPVPKGGRQPAERRTTVKRSSVNSKAT
jgi:glycosyltransferase involved in cell wall biosynthesis